MPRARLLKPSLFKNEELADLGLETRLLFTGLWCLADREGRLEDRPRRIKADVLPYDDCDVDALLDRLHAAGFIQRYQVAGERYIAVINFLKHQTPHVKEAASVIPAPDKSDTSTSKAPDETSPISPRTSSSSFNPIPLAVTGNPEDEARVRATAAQNTEDRRESPRVAVSAAPAAAPENEAPSKALTPAPKPNRQAEVIDLIRDGGGGDPTMTGRDGKAIKDCSASAAKIAEAYLAAQRGDWDPGGTGWLQGNLSIHEVIGRLDGYQASKAGKGNGTNGDNGRSNNGRAGPPRRFHTDHL